MDADFWGPVFAIAIISMLCVILPWMVLHYVTRWKTAATLTSADEKLLDELHELARRIDERQTTIERILAADNPGWRQVACDPASTGIEDLSSTRRIVQ